MIAACATITLYHGNTRPASLMGARPFQYHRHETPRHAETDANSAPASPLAADAESGTPGPNPRALARQVVPVSIRDILPRLTEPVADWRAFKPEKIAIAPYPGQDIEFTATAITEEHGRTVWVGRTDKEGAFLVTVAAEDHWNATLALTSMASTYQFRIDENGQATEIIIPHELQTCGAEAASGDAPSAGGSTGKNYLAPPDLYVDDTGEAANFVDVLVFYDEDVLTTEGGNAEKIKTRALEDITCGNQILKNSDIEVMRWRLIDIVQIPKYTRRNDLVYDLNVFSNFTGKQETEAGNFAAGKASERGADQMLLYLGDDADPAYWGMAWLYYDAKTLCHESVAYYGAGYITTIHELGHNFGCRHDREQSAKDESPARDSDGMYNYAHKWTKQGTYGTVMAYAPFIVPAFSNPSFQYEGDILGVPETQPRAANNARILTENGPRMAAYRKSTISSGGGDESWWKGPTDPGVITEGAQSGGSSSGGSPSLWYLSAIVLLVALRLRRDTRKA